MELVKLILAVFVIGLFTSCENENEIYNHVLLGYNESFTSESGFTLHMDSVLNDSRCPTEYVCVWAGNAKVRFKYVSAENTEFIFNLNTTLVPCDTLIEEVRITMLKLSPYPIADELIEQEDYVVELLISKE